MAEQTNLGKKRFQDSGCFMHIDAFSLAQHLSFQPCSTSVSCSSFCKSEGTCHMVLSQNGWYPRRAILMRKEKKTLGPCAQPFKSRIAGQSGEPLWVIKLSLEFACGCGHKTPSLQAVSGLLASSECRLPVLLQKSSLPSSNFPNSAGWILVHDWKLVRSMDTKNWGSGVYQYIWLPKTECTLNPGICWRCKLLYFKGKACLSQRHGFRHKALAPVKWHSR